MADQDHTTFKLHIRYAGASMGSLKWSALREFIDHLGQALAAMPNGPNADDVIPIALKDGSIKPTVQIPRSALPAINMLRKGPNRRWTPEIRRKAEPLYNWARERDATISGGRRGERKFSIPPVLTEVTYKEHTSLYGTVLKLGGKEGKVTIRFDLEGTKVCDAGRELVVQMAPAIYERVRVDGEVKRDRDTGALVAFQITSFSRLGPVGSRKDFVRELREVVGNSMDGFDVAVYIKELRE